MPDSAVDAFLGQPKAQSRASPESEAVGLSPDGRTPRDALMVTVASLG
jgi:hypothetical protein